MTNAVSAALLADNKDHRFQSNEIHTDLQSIDCSLVVTWTSMSTFKGHEPKPAMTN